MSNTPIFWSYDDEHSTITPAIQIEHILKYGDTVDLIALFKQFTMAEIVKVWHLNMQDDNRFEKQNFFLKTFFIPKAESEKILENRYEKLKKLAAKHRESTN